ncbi:DUF4267 domain-containing protein [Pseudactinotalea sp. Z1732]|uniref:DUF4267 domain-containing protein n=1 Tax=Micrococcales TaxID=85006 RepID=UPI003C7AE3EC
MVATEGVRDLATGVVAGVLIFLASPVVVGAAMLALAIVPASDALVVLRGAGSTSTALGMHGATAAVMVLGGLLLVLG